jgi:pimeloyl-ACP methyl ester carboxylesterase
VAWGAVASTVVRTVLVAGGVIVALVLAVKIAALALEPRLTFYPVRDYAGTPAAAGLPFEDVVLRTSDGVTVHGWFVPAAEAPSVAAAEAPRVPPGRAALSGSRRPITLLFFHGNAENIGGCLDLAARTRAAGFNLLLMDYRGYGESAGRPSEQGLYGDGEAALRDLGARAGVDPGRIVVWGRSIGAAVAVHLAARGAGGTDSSGDRDATPGLAGLILESPFTSVPDLLRQGGHAVLLALSRFGSYRFDSAALMGRVTAPVLVVHGTDDEIAPFELGRRLFDLAPGTKEMVAIRGGGHNDLWTLHADEVWDAVRGFLESLK